MKYITIFHANLNYAYLTPDRYEFVIRTAYEMTIDTLREVFPNTKYVFEASGYTIEEIAKKTPDVLAKLKAAIASGRCEFMGSPYAHPMLPNFPEEDGLWSLKFSNEVYQKYLGIQPKSFWNPECGWRSYIPRQVINAGYKNLVADFEAYSIAKKPDGTPQRPEIYKEEYTEEKKFYNFGFKYELPGDEKALHFPFSNVVGGQGKLKTFLRSDRVCQFGVRYFMGMEGYSLNEYMALIRKYSQQKAGEPEGALVVFADDAEYVGTNGWFKLKYMNQPDNVFEAVQSAKQKLIDFITECQKLGEFTTFDNACNNLSPIDDILYFDDDAAWHGAKASVWAQTPMARLLRPWQDLVREELEKLTKNGNLEECAIKRAWYHLTNSYNSDGQWPPTLPHAPHIIHPFNYSYCFENLLAAELIVGGIDRTKLDTDPVETLKEILTIQQNLILEKAERVAASADNIEKAKGLEAGSMIEKSRNYSSIISSKAKILYASEYTIRAETLAHARRIVGGIVIETVNASLRKN
jgi:alpha-amylase/alpha-mannosidase (GH57 family)